MDITVLLFATLKDHAGTDRLRLTLPGEQATLRDVITHLRSQYAELSNVLGMAVAAINQEFAFAPDPVHHGDEVAFFPPVSGGTGDPVMEQRWTEIFRIEAGEIDLNELTSAITTPQTGAVCLFSGYVRGETTSEGKLLMTARLDYEAYEPMALAKMKQVATEIRERWSLVQGIAIVQRIGTLQVGEPTVLIAVASGHRDQGCFEAARYGIDRLKEIVPIWKKEISADGSQWVEGHYKPNEADKAQ
ncbi:MAG: molybdopterin converting factor subunit 1 [Anaerolineae bacterium]|nr:molybdopterin converting factor subunit 1 [Anaerolineae bacterium]